MRMKKWLCSVFSQFISSNEIFEEAANYGRDGGDCSYYSDDCQTLDSFFS